MISLYITWLSGLRGQDQDFSAEHHDQHAQVFHPWFGGRHRVLRWDLRRQLQRKVGQDALWDFHFAGKKDDTSWKFVTHMFLVVQGSAVTS